MTAEFCTMELQEILDVVCDQCPGINCKNCTYEQVINYASKCIRYLEEKKEPNIIYCKDCVYYRSPEKYLYKDSNLYCCRSALVKVSENDFCSKAIRKEGEA